MRHTYWPIPRRNDGAAWASYVLAGAFLLTATPISNRLIDLYSLIDLIRPGMLGTQREFENEYVADPGTARMLKPQMAEKLRSTVRQVICRTRRSETDIVFSGRTVHTRVDRRNPERRCSHQRHHRVPSTALPASAASSLACQWSQKAYAAPTPPAAALLIRREPGSIGAR